ncbi:MAG: hypothetical protein WKG06_38010 [Segetibacter sp.]
MASPNPKPSIPNTGAILTPCLDVCPSNVPTIGPVQLKLTITSVRAIKKIPVNPPSPAFSSDLFAQLLGSEISKAPKNEIAKMIKMAKKSRLLTGCVEILYNVLSPKIKVRISVGMVYIKIIHKEYQIAFRNPSARDLLLFKKNLPLQVQEEKHKVLIQLKDL